MKHADLTHPAAGTSAAPRSAARLTRSRPGTTADSIAAPHPTGQSGAPHLSVETLLLAPRQLDEHLEWLQDTALLDGPQHASQLAQRWRNAAIVYEALQQSDPGAADAAVVLDLPAESRRHVQRLIRTAAFRNSHACVPVAFGMVPLDHLVVSQFSLTQSSVAGLLRAVARPCGTEQLAALCLPLQPSSGTCRLVARDEAEFTFNAPAHDFRFLGPAPLDAAALQRLRLPGHALGGVALALGHSCNLLEVVRHGGRLVLNNGHHRAQALRLAGHTHAPCLIQVCASQDDLVQVAQSEIMRNNDLYFESARPPMLRDFCNPELTHQAATPQLRREIRISFRVESRLVAA